MRWCEQPQAFPALRDELDHRYRLPDQVDLRLYVLHNHMLQEAHG
jgi:hypothetical protein